MIYGSTRKIEPSLSGSRIRHSLRCIFCGTPNKVRSPKAIFFHCKNPECKQINPGPGMSAAHAKAMTNALQPIEANGKKKRNGAAPLVTQLPAPAAAATVIKAANTTTSTPTPTEPAPKARAKAPATPPPPKEKRGGLAQLIYG